MSDRLAIHGGAPVRAEPFGPRHDFGDDDIAALTEVVRSGHVGKGPKVDAFERAFAAGPAREDRLVNRHEGVEHGGEGFSEFCQPSW